MTNLTLTIESRMYQTLDQFSDYVLERSDDAAVSAASLIIKHATNLAPVDTGNLREGHYIVGRSHRFVSHPNFTNIGRRRRYPKTTIGKRGNEFSNATSRAMSRMGSTSSVGQTGQAILGFSASYAKGVNDNVYRFLREPHRYKSLLLKATRESFRSKFRNFGVGSR